MNFRDLAHQLISSSYKANSHGRICNILKFKCIPDYSCILTLKHLESVIFWQSQFRVVDYKGVLC